MTRQNNRQTTRFSPYVYQPVSRQLPSITPPRRHRHRKLPLLVAAAVVLFLGWHLVKHHPHAAAHELDSTPRLVVSTASANNLNTLQSVINQQIARNPQLDLSVVLGSATNDAPLEQYGTTASFDAASTAKLLTAADYLHHVVAGDMSLQTQIDGASAKQSLQAMIVQSDDTAWLDLNDYLSHEDLVTYAASIGYRDYNVTDNTMPAYNSALLLQKLYAGTLLDKASTSLLLNYLRQANYRDYIIPAVPSGYTAYHKVGITNDDVHDAAIIAHGDKAIVVAIYTNGHGSYDWPDRASMMQAITRAAIAAYQL